MLHILCSYRYFPRLRDTGRNHIVLYNSMFGTNKNHMIGLVGEAVTRFTEIQLVLENQGIS